MRRRRSRRSAIYSIIEFAIPVAPAFVVVGAAGSSVRRCERRYALASRDEHAAARTSSPEQSSNACSASWSIRTRALATLADMCRVNALVAVKRAGSGHLGSSFSAMDVVAFLLFEELNTARLGWEHPDRDVYFSSKGHDVPGLYAALFALGVIPRERLPSACVGSAGSTGIRTSVCPESRRTPARSAWGSRRRAASHGRSGTSVAGGRVVVMVGDGELQEGQNYEGLQAAAHEGLCRAHGRRRPERAPVRQADRRDRLPRRARGADFEPSAGTSNRVTATTCPPCASAFAACREHDDRPQALVARTIKGKGVSFMEHPVALREGGGTYRWHAGAPDDDAFERAFAELVERVSGAARRTRPRAARARACRSVDDRRAGSLEGEPESGAGVAPASRRVRRRRVRRRARPARRSSARTSSCSTRTSPRTAAFEPSSSPIRTASSSAASPSRTWSRRLRDSRGTACFPS